MLGDVGKYCSQYSMREKELTEGLELREMSKKEGDKSRSQTNMICRLVLATAGDARRSAGYASELLASPLTIVLIGNVHV
jgi:hypothetical protein